ncbi:ribonuclease HII [beta proteobacterium MWH-UniP1]
MIVGVDEAGRGPLAGPVCAAAVILGADHGLVGLADSKVLSEKKREQLAPKIQADSLAWGIGWASVEEIDQIDILRATFLAMARAVECCLQRLASSQPVIDPRSLEVQVDGNRSPGDFQGPWHWPYATQTIVKGDQKVAEISAASILAKTARDAEMRRLHEVYPAYGFAQHAGYGTAAHLQALQEHGVTPVHRRSFAPVARALEKMQGQDHAH